MKKLLNIGAALSFVFFTSSCGKDFLDVNRDPNNPNDAPAELVLPAAITSTAGVVGGDYAILGGLWSQHWTQNNGSNQYKDLDAFNLQSTTLQRNWQELYSGALNDYKFVRTKAVAAEDWNMNLMATVMEAYTYQILVDLYDEIPFDEALQGEANLNPHFQSGEEVYDGLIARLDEALSKPTTATSLAGDQDVVFGGNMNQWRRFANTLKLKIYMRQSYARPQVAQAGIAAMYAANAQFLNTDAAMAIFQDLPSGSNPLYEQDQRQLNTTQNLRASTTLLSFMDVNSDPRIDEYFIPGSGGQKSLNQGEFDRPSTQVVPTSLSRARITADAPVYFISESESYFLQAEAALRGWGTGNAETLYNQGVDAAFEQAGETRGTLYAFPSAGSFDDKLEAIITQKWVAMAGTKQGLESFFERNRTNIPATSAVTSPTPTSANGAWVAGTALDPAYTPGEFVYPKNGTTTNKQFATRLLFPNIERSRNPNTPAQVDFTEKVWWDVN